MDVVTMSRFDLNKASDRDLLRSYMETFGINDNIETYYDSETLCSMYYGSNIAYTNDFTDYLPFVFNENVTTFTYNCHTGRVYMSSCGQARGTVFYATYPELLEKLK